MKSRLPYLLSFGLAVLLLWVALRGLSFDQLLHALSEADYRWLLPAVVVIVLSHVFRAWRWKLMLDDLPEVQIRLHKIQFRTSLYSILIGYMANNVLPRIGEVLRVANLAKQEKLPFSSVLGTVVADRTSDVMITGFGFLSLFWIAQDKLWASYQEYVIPFTGRFGSATVWALGMLSLIGAGFLIWKLKHSPRAKSLIEAFGRGFFTILTAPNRLSMLVSTLLIWGSYWSMVVFCAWMLHLDVPNGWSLADSWTLLMLGSLGSIAPTPGGTGSYHVVIRWTLVTLWGLSDETAVAFAVVTHALQLILYTVLGLMSLMLQGISLADLRLFGQTEEREARQSS